jgi:hypothetical protein
VDVSADGKTWTRTRDTKGPPNRVVTVGGLSPGREYRSRIICYFTQQNDGLLYTDYKNDQITTQTFTTLNGAAGRP